MAKLCHGTRILSHLGHGTFGHFAEDFSSDLIGFLVVDQLALAGLHPVLDRGVFVEHVSISRLQNIQSVLD